MKDLKLDLDEGIIQKDNNMGKNDNKVKKKKKEINHPDSDMHSLSWNRSSRKGRIPGT